MKSLDEQRLNSFSINLIDEARSIIHPKKLAFMTTDELPSTVKAQHIEEENGDYIVFLRDDSINDYTLSHEVLHILARRVIPSFVKVLEVDLISVIGGELQGYLEHNWILAEQRKRGLEIDVFALWGDIQDTIGPDEEGINNFKRIMILNNLIRSFPEVFEMNYDFFKTNNPLALSSAEKIMAHYPKKELLSHYEAKSSTVRAINEWKNIFSDNDLIANHLTYQISVMPVFSQNQLDKMTNLTLGLITEAFTSDDEKETYHVIHTLNDNQCSVIFQAEADDLQLIKIDIDRFTLGDFLNHFPLPYLMR